MPKSLRFPDLRHTGHTVSAPSGATLKDAMLPAGQSSEEAELIYQHSDRELRKEIAGGLNGMARAARKRAAEQAAKEPRVREWCGTSEAV